MTDDGLTEAQHLIEVLGFALVPIPRGLKGPVTPGWNDPDNAITRADQLGRLTGMGIGLLHAESRTCTLDIDDEPATRQALSEVGLSLDALLTNPVRIQGKRGEKPLWRVPDGLALSRHALAWPDDAQQPRNGGRPFTVFELRAGRLQDVLPPTFHPDTGQPYRWVNGRPETRDDIPELPEDLLVLWERWSAFLPALRAACPWTPATLTPSHAQPRHAESPRSTPQDSVIHAYNDRTDLNTLLERHHYRRVGSAWLAPTSQSGRPGVRLLPEVSASGHPVVYSHHASDPLAGEYPHDAFSIYCTLEHEGDVTKAVRAAAQLLGMAHASKPHGPPQQESASLTPEEQLRQAWPRLTPTQRERAAYFLAQALYDRASPEQLVTYFRTLQYDAKKAIRQAYLDAGTGNRSARTDLADHLALALHPSPRLR